MLAESVAGPCQDPETMRGDGVKVTLLPWPSASKNCRSMLNGFLERIQHSGKLSDRELYEFIPSRQVRGVIALARKGKAPLVKTFIQNGERFFVLTPAGIRRLECDP